MDRKIKAYTTLELLLVISILGILSFLFVREFLIYISRERLKNATEELASLISNCKNRSILSSQNCGYCLNGTHSIIFFLDNNKDGIFNANSDTIFSHFSKESENIQIGNGTTLSTCPQAALFDKRGELISGGAVAHSIILKNKYEEKRKITVNLLGRISVEAQ
ncbi:MAG: Tfp pilus assembly protein FimT/FimU [Caldimicrobium sp.]